MKAIPFFTGFALVIYSGTAYAAPPDNSSWEVFAMGALGTGFWFWVNSVSKKQQDTDKAIALLQTALLSQYHPKQDIAAMMIEVKTSLREFRDEARSNQHKLEDRFDKFENLYGR